MVAVAAPVRPTLYSVNDAGQLRLHMHPGQMRAWDAKERFVAVISGSQGGKTSWSPFWLYREILRCGPGDYIAVTATFDLLKLAFLPALRMTFETVLKWGRYRGGDRVIELSNPATGMYDDPPWARIILRSAASGGGLESATAKAAIFDEAGQDEVDLEIWEALLRRLALNQGRVLITTTPYIENWLKYEVYDRWEKGDPNYAVINFPSIANPVFPREEYERARATMPAWRFALFHEGLFTRPAGMVYDCFDARIHVVDDFALPSEWPRYVGLDFGGVNHAMVWIARHPETGACYVYREEMLPDMTTQERATEARKHLATEQVLIWSGGSGSEEQYRRDWTAAGVAVQQPLIDGVESGINAVTEQFKRQKLLIFRSCTGLKDELGSYRRQLDDRGQPTLTIVDKRAYHRLDALRYIVPWLTTSGPNLRFF